MPLLDGGVSDRIDELENLIARLADALLSEEGPFPSHDELEQLCGEVANILPLGLLPVWLVRYRDVN